MDLKIKPIKRYENYFVREDGKVFASNWRRRGITKELTYQYKKGTNYVRVELSRKSKCKKFSVHRLIAEAFIPNLFGKPHVNHLNGIKDDNRACNLEWCTNSENILHALKNKLYEPIKGSQIGTSLLNETQVLNIKKELKKNKTCSSISTDYGVSPKTINDIKLGKSWGWLI